MLTQDNLVDLLNALDFKKRGAIYRKAIGPAVFEVNLTKKEIIYPEDAGLIVNERQTCNFSANENFVVFECVHRLLEKGYKPKHIELEPKWKLGHGASGGRADILVKDNFGKPLLIIECKTAGTEFKKAWNKTLQDGDQLFSYAQQISETRFLCLYASDFENAKLRYQSHIIAHRDNEKYLAANPHYKSFRSATDVKERFAVWHDTYKLDFTTKGIFEDNIQPYQIGKDKYSLADLHAISASDQQKKYHEFATILRQHNVSGRENAFDKLVNLFLCKLVDEIENPDDLKFYWKGVAYDSHFDLMDRLQQLYQQGMKKFLGEDITYINQNDVNNALRFIRQNPDATQRAVWNLFIQQKFFTNNDFSFIDVHNERLFYKNAEVLLKILQMWQDIRLTNPGGHNQFLGDLFEGFLDQGVKQSEGQFFTPMPICRFILMSLPLESLVRDNPTPPMAIDYACGAGHFLTELALQLQPLLEHHKPQANPAEYHKSMVGIEKEYRLSKVAKVSAFMYGYQGIQICYGDGLVKSHDDFPDIRDGHFDLLVANPPYSVRGFLETLPEEERKAYTLTDTINDAETANSIETFFVERAKQLLKSGGVAAIILPSSILSNGGSTYIRAREILLQYFDIVAIAEFGSGTFGKTGTNTVTLFLRRKPTQPDTAEHYRERVEEWFKGCAASPRKQVIYKDAHLIEQYCAHINVPLADYQSLLRGEADGSWKQQAHFQPYHDAFQKSTELKNLKKTKKFKALSKAKQTAEIAKRYLGYVQTIERDKLYHFCLASSQTNPVLIIRSPSGTKEIKQFLGYEWSSAKGDEGIKLILGADGQHATTLYDGPNRTNPMQFTRTNPNKLNHYIVANFDGALGAIPKDIQSFAKPARLIDVLDFGRSDFDKTLTLAPATGTTVGSKWPLKTVATLMQPIIGAKTKVADKSISSNGSVPVVTQGKDRLIDGYVDNKEPITDLPLIVFGDHTCTFKYVDFPFVRGADGTQLIKCDKNTINTKYLYFFFEGLEVHNSGKYERHFKYLKTEKVPVPEEKTQLKIVKECEAIDRQVEKAKSEIESARKAFADILSDAEHMGTLSPLGKVIHKVSNSIDPQSESGIAHYLGLENIESNTGQLVGELYTPYAEIKSTKTSFKSGDILYGKLRPNLNKVYLAKQDGICSTDILVLRPKSKEEGIFYARYFLSKSFNDAVVNTVSGQQLPRTSWGKMQVIKIPVLKTHDLAAVTAKIEALEKQIADAQAIIDAAPARKEAVMKKYL